MRNRLQLLQEILAKTPNDSFALFAIAKEYEGRGENSQALYHYLQLRSADSDYVGLYYHLGKLYEKTGNPEAALEAYQAGMAVAKKLGDNHAYSELNGARFELDDTDDDY